MMGDYDIGPQADRRLDHLDRGIEGESHSTDKHVRITGEQATPVPLFGALQRKPVRDGPLDVAHCHRPHSSIDLISSCEIGNDTCLYPASCSAA